MGSFEGTYGLFACDLDGTLLDSKKRISKTVARTLEALAARGVVVAFSSGRNVPECLPYLEALPFVRYASLLNGAVVTDLTERRCLTIHAIEDEVALEIARIGEETDTYVQVLAPEHSVVPKERLACLADFGQEEFAPLLHEVATPVDHVGAWMAAHPGLMTKINVHHRTADARERTRKRLAGLPLTVTPGLGNTLELTAPDVTKALGLTELARELHLPLTRVATIGDSANDLPAFAVAGCAVAVGNAEEEVLRGADLVVADADHDGVAEAARILFGV